MSDETKALTPTVMPDISIDENGVMRDRKTGKLLPGTVSPNPSGRPGGQKTLRRELKKRFGEDGKGLVKKLEEIIEYDYDVDKKEHPEKFKPKYEAHHQLKALEMAMHYLFGKPSESMHVDQAVDLTIETKMHKVAKLINDNKDKLRIIQGGGPVDVITDV